MTTNTTVLIIVAATAALLLASMIAGVAFKTRTRQRHVEGETIRHQAEENALTVGHPEALVDESVLKAHAAQDEVDIKTAGACRLQRQEAVYRSEAATSRNQLNEQRNRADRLNADVDTAETARLAGLTKLYD
jgi:hypothetical protein